ncbi:hypothetical protein CEF21_15050 [Bacillus sp. FJAT-42376]|uniref:hypothetical protein n=1 Tax=Bacillus sp. FJAT-42376 TaxID=2014076 RepID=UPI000F4F0026|nr:hypothetical protein [Bacillus sp. FJAT-42376]AZB43513.1 hypothetical protein CEF21_15050 [Bacillus sp. FJAT-42376]
MTKIKVIDAIMGSGKTSWAIQHMNENPADKKFIYITPFLTEVARVKGGVANRKFIEPNLANAERKKLRSLKELIVGGYDIVATHSLFQAADDELIELLTGSGYTLILDEVMDVIDYANVNATDIRRLLDTGDIDLNENKVVWKGDPEDNSRYMDIRLLAQAGNLFYHRGRFLIWAFPPQVFHTFDEVFVMTYMFSGQTQRYYYDLYRFEYEYQSVRLVDGRYELCAYNAKAENRTEIMKLIEIYDGKMNAIADRDNALGAGWLRRADEKTINQFSKNIYNFFSNVAGAKKGEVLWTTLKVREKAMCPKSYKRGTFLACTARATNEYKDRWALAYVFNRFLNPVERAFFEDNNVTVNQNAIAVSDLLQWVWRSRIREGQPIKLYLPSSRMRGLLKAWANYEI